MRCEREDKTNRVMSEVGKRKVISYLNVQVAAITFNLQNISIYSLSYGVNASFNYLLSIIDAFDLGAQTVFITHTHTLTLLFFLSYHLSSINFFLIIVFHCSYIFVYGKREGMGLVQSMCVLLGILRYMAEVVN